MLPTPSLSLFVSCVILYKGINTDKTPTETHAETHAEEQNTLMSVPDQDGRITWLGPRAPKGYPLLPGSWRKDSPGWGKMQRKNSLRPRPDCVCVCVLCRHLKCTCVLLCVICATINWLKSALLKKNRIEKKLNGIKIYSILLNTQHPALYPVNKQHCQDFGCNTLLN